MAPGYAVQETESSKKGRNFVSASNHSIPNLGEVVVPMQSEEGNWTRQRWQIGRGITRPLLSVAQECDEENIVIYGSNGGAILNLHGRPVRRFRRVGGTYELDMWLPPAATMKKLASVFGRQGM